MGQNSPNDLWSTINDQIKLSHLSHIDIVCIVITTQLVVSVFFYYYTRMSRKYKSR